MLKRVISIQKFGFYVIYFMVVNHNANKETEVCKRDNTASTYHHILALLRHNLSHLGAA